MGKYLDELTKSFRDRFHKEEFYNEIFPIEGISIGKTTKSEVFDQFQIDNSQDYEKSISFKAVRDDGREFEYSLWFSHGIVKTIGFLDGLPENFDSLGISIDDSYNDWKEIFNLFEFKEVYNNHDDIDCNDIFISRFYNPFEGLSFTLSIKKQDFDENKCYTIQCLLIEYDIPDECFDEMDELDDDEDGAKDVGPFLTSRRKLYELIGLQKVKDEVSSLANLVKVQKMRQDRGMRAIPISYHCVFTGNPGTGKTTVARLLAEIYKELGILSSGHLIETDRSGLVAEYVGQTAVKTNKVIDSALDGVLFIDEAYSLVQGGDNDFGKEAISTLLKRMEDDRDKLVVILAGYSKEMEDFINSNSGLQSRFSRFINFPDYSSQELFDIFKLMVSQNDMVCSSDALCVVENYIKIACNNKDERFGNGRFIRNYFEKVLMMQANRLSQYSKITNEMLSSIEIDDVLIE